MSTQAQRGRKVDNKNAKTLRVFYIVLAAIAVVGVALLIIYLVRNQGGSTYGWSGDRYHGADLAAQCTDGNDAGGVLL